MKGINIAYWVFTGIFGALMLFSAIPDIISSPEAIVFFEKMGYPAYISPFLGVAKTLGVIAILVPGFPRIKEWAYAGLFFDLIGATYSMMMSKIPEGSPVAMLMFILPGIASYYFYHKRLKARAAAGKI